MTKRTVFSSIPAALKYALNTGNSVSVDIKQASEQLTGGLGALSKSEVWAIKQMRARHKYEAAVHSGSYGWKRSTKAPAIKII